MFLQKHLLNLSIFIYLKKESIKTDDNFQYLDIYYHVYHSKLDRRLLLDV